MSDASPPGARAPTALTPDDDGFHAAADAHPYWTETSWYAFNVPEQRLCGAVYPLFRPNLGTAALAVHVWDDDAFEPWRVRYGRALWHLPMPDADLRRCSFAGLELETLEPLHRYRLRYADGDRLALDLTYEGVRPPHALVAEPTRGHIDHPCRVRGSLRLGADTLEVDGFEMRDRSWSVRDDLRSTRAGYAYAIDAERAFLAMSFGEDEAPVVAGFLWQDGQQHTLVSGTRRVLSRDRRGGYPKRVSIEAQDAAGRSLEAEARCLSRLAFQATPGLFSWMSLAEWHWDGATSFGEDQDIWSPDRLGG